MKYLILLAVMMTALLYFKASTAADHAVEAQKTRVEAAYAELNVSETRVNF